jgi:lysophospholipase L1-like esterase
MDGDVVTRLPDPWALPVDRARYGRRSGWISGAGLLVLGAAGPVARLWSQGFAARALWLVVASLVWAAVLARRPRDPWGVVLLGAVATAVVLFSWPSMGRAPALVALCGVALARTLTSLPASAGSSGQGTSLAGLAILPLVAAQVTWFRHARPAVTAALFLASFLVVLAYRRAPAAVGFLDAQLRRVLSAAASILGGAVLFVVATVVLYLPGAAGALLDLHRRRRARPSYWHNRTMDSRQVARDAHHPFAATEPRVRLRRHLTGAAALVMVGLVLTTVNGRGGATLSDEQVDVFERGRAVRFSSLEAYRGVSFADALKAEQDVFSNEHLIPAAIGGYDVDDFTGRYTNVSEGVRRTIEPPACDTCTNATIWLAGGSAAFGLGQRDDHTIASELVRLAAEDGISLQVTNLGVPGWTLHQEVQKVLSRLDAGKGPPDLVLFYNGYNDVIGTVIDSAVNGVRPDQPALMDTEDIRAFTSAGLDPALAGTAKEIGALAAAKYERERRRIVRLLAQRGIPAFHVFQPDALADDRQYTHVKGIYEVGDNDREFFDTALRFASMQLAPAVVDLRHSLDSAPPVFADLVHTNEEGARRVARALYPLVRDQLH